MKRIESLYKDIDGYSYLGIAASTDYESFDLSRPDLLECLKTYVNEEQKGGYKYTFGNDNDDVINAESALKNYIEKGISPLTNGKHIFLNIMDKCKTI